MKIIQQYTHGDANILQLEEVEIPVIAEQEVLIKGAYTSVNFADVTVGSVDKLQMVKELGAHVVFTYDEFVKGVNELTESEGANVILDSIAGDITQQSLKCLAYYGTLVQFGNSSGQTGTISTNDVHASCRNVKGFSLGTTRKENPERLQPVVKKIIPYMEERMIQIPIAHVYPLQDIQKAHRLMESRMHKGKILIKLNDD